MDEWPDNCAVKFTTLEEIEIDCEWSVEMGIKVITVFSPKTPAKDWSSKHQKFDSLEALFSEYSDAYKDKF